MCLKRNENNKVKFDKNKFKYSTGWLDNKINPKTSENYKSTDVNYNNIKLGEFQTHSNRDNIKFRFYYKGLLKMLE